METPTLFKSRGCQACNNTGFKGRTAIHEVLTITDELAMAINDRKSPTEMATIAKRVGFRTLSYDGYIKVLTGVTTFREIEKVAVV